MMERERATEDLVYLEQLLARSKSRIDPHAFHFVHWGWIVLVWYPLANLFELLGHPWWQLPLGIAALVTGFALSGIRERRLAIAPRLLGEDPTVARQLSMITLVVVAATMVLSGLAPATGFVDGRDVPILWGLAYAVLAAMTGVVYRREFLWAGIAIFAGVILAMFLSEWSGFILGPFMGIGLIVPGRRAERRVETAQREGAEPAVEGL